MGAYVSLPDCQRQFNVTLNCSAPHRGPDGFFDSMGGINRGEFSADPDVAGVGVLSAFTSVTALALLLSIISSIWWLQKNVVNVIKNRTPSTSEYAPGGRWQLSVTGLCETLVVTCSDQQVFTGMAYAITLRYSRGCAISAYHYNIIANMMLLTCATHLMAVTVSRNYWEHPLIAAVRVAITTGVFIVTGVMLSNAGSAKSGFPTEVPRANTTDSLMFMQAACFQQDASLFTSDLRGSFSSFNQLKSALTGSRVHGWDQYLAMLLFYFLAIFVGLGRFFRRGAKPGGQRARLGAWAEKTFSPVLRLKWFGCVVFALYLVGGVTIAAWTVGQSAWYIVYLRRWVSASGWMALNNGMNPENDPTTFGQLVPLLLIALTIFTMLQVLSERLQYRKMAKQEDEHEKSFSPSKIAELEDSEKAPQLPPKDFLGDPLKGPRVQVKRVDTSHSGRISSFGDMGLPFGVMVSHERGLSSASTIVTRM